MPLNLSLGILASTGKCVAILRNDDCRDLLKEWKARLAEGIRHSGYVAASRAWQFSCAMNRHIRFLGNLASTAHSARNEAHPIRQHALTL